MVFNHIMTEWVVSVSSWLVNGCGEKRLSVDELRELTTESEENPLLKKYPVHYGNLDIYWCRQKKTEFWLPLSAGDMQWDGLQKPMPRFQEYWTGY